MLSGVLFGVGQLWLGAVGLVAAYLFMEWLWVSRLRGFKAAMAWSSALTLAGAGFVAIAGAVVLLVGHACRIAEVVK